MVPQKSWLPQEAFLKMDFQQKLTPPFFDIFTRGYGPLKIMGYVCTALDGSMVDISKWNP